LAHLKCTYRTGFSPRFPPGPEEPQFTAKERSGYDAERRKQGIYSRFTSAALHAMGTIESDDAGHLI
jgi:hypothetical protein